MAKLVVVESPGARPKVVTLGADPLTVGREPDNEIQLDSLEVSRRHCRFEPLAKGGYRVLDLKSKNGTFLNGRPVTAMALDFEDQVRIGDAVLVYVEDAVTPEEAVSRIDPGTTWLPLKDEAGNLLRDEGADLLGEAVDQQDVSTWRARRDGPDPHTRASNRSYLKERLLRLGMLTQNIASAPDLSRLMGTILDEVLDFTCFERGLLLLADEEAQSPRLQPVLGRYMDHEHLEDAERKFSRGLVEEALRDQRIAYRFGLASAESSFSLRESVISMGLESALCIPLFVHERTTARPTKDDRRRRRPRSRVLGAIYLDSTREIRPLDQADLQLLEAVAAQAAIALQNARLQHQATTDPLTGLNNRSFLKQAFEEELRAAREEQTELGVLILDLDHFKKVNDTYGHGVGDEVLKRVAQRIRRSVRRDDFTARWGGEEFLVLLPGTDEEGTRLVAEKIAEAIKGQPIGEAAIRVTVSIGMAVFPKHGKEPGLLIKRADQALYAAKAAGRDRVVTFSAGLDKTGHRVDPFAGLFDGDPAHTQRNLKAIFDTIDLLRSKRPAREILDRTLDNVCDLTRARRALLIVEGQDGELRVAAARRQGGRDGAESDHEEFSRSTARTALREDRSLCLLDAGGGPLSTSSIDRLGLNTVMCVPLKIGGQGVGVLYADDTVANREFTDRDLSHLEMIAHQLTLTLSANPDISAAVLGSGSEARRDETTRLRDEVARLRAELDGFKAQTRRHQRPKIEGRSDARQGAGDEATD